MNATWRLPSIATTSAVTVCVVGAFAPGLLPRPAILQGVFTGLCAFLGFVVARTLRLVSRRPVRIDPVPRTRLFALAGATACVSAAAIAADSWQDRLRTAMGAAPVGFDYWAGVSSAAVLTFAIALGVATAAAWILRILLRSRSVAMLVAGCLLAGFAAAWWSAGASPARARSLDVAGASVSWQSLGQEGRRFVDVPDRGSAARIYIGLDSAPTPRARARLAVSELERTGALSKSNIVLAVPTGSGWIDANAVRGLQTRFHDDVALVGQQYSAAPSWVGFLFGRSRAVESASELLSAVSQRLHAIPAQHRPRLFVYGQSLGALAGAAALRAHPDSAREVCATLWAGPPAGSTEPGGARVLANGSDPVVRWSGALALHTPRLDDTRPDAPMPQWIPVLSFVQTSVDLLTALAAPAGHGHRYGTDQGTEMGRC